MRHPIVIPSLGLVEAVTLIEWVKTSGDTVAAGDIVAVVETEKAQVDIESPASGVLEIAVQPGPDLLDVASPLGFIEVDD